MHRDLSLENSPGRPRPEPQPSDASEPRRPHPGWECGIERFRTTLTENVYVERRDAAVSRQDPAGLKRVTTGSTAGEEPHGGFVPPSVSLLRRVVGVAHRDAQREVHVE